MQNGLNVHENQPWEQLTQSQEQWDVWVNIFSPKERRKATCHSAECLVAILSKRCHRVQVAIELATESNPYEAKVEPVLRVNLKFSHFFWFTFL